MKKSDLIAALAVKENLTGKLSIDIVNLVFDGFATALKSCGRVEIRGFGFESVNRPYRSFFFLETDGLLPTINDVIS